MSDNGAGERRCRQVRRRRPRHDKRGAGYGYTGKLGYHPIVATRADTNEVLHVRIACVTAARIRSAAGCAAFDELIARVRKAGASGPVLLRADSRSWNKKVTARLRAPGL